MLSAHDISRITAQKNRGIKDELKSLLQGKGLANRRDNVEVKGIRALKLGFH